MTIRKQCEKLYKDAFGESEKFDNMLFDMFFKNIEFFEKDGIVTAMYFKIPCTLNLNGISHKAYYIYAVTTHSDYRHQGIMSQLFAKTTNQPDTLYFLKPSNEKVIKFYNQANFKQIVGTSELCDAIIQVNDDFKKLSKICDKPKTTYTLMVKGVPNINKLTFKYTLE